MDCWKVLIVKYGLCRQSDGVVIEARNSSPYTQDEVDAMLNHSGEQCDTVLLPEEVGAGWVWDGSDYSEPVPADNSWMDAFAQAREDMILNGDPKGIMNLSEENRPMWKNCVYFNDIGIMAKSQECRDAILAQDAYPQS
jgi:phage terminase large subunit-like protein